MRSFHSSGLLGLLGGLSDLDPVRAIRTDSDGGFKTVDSTDIMPQRGLDIGGGGVIAGIGVHLLQGNQRARSVVTQGNFGRVDGKAFAAAVQNDIDLNSGNFLLRFAALNETAAVHLTDGDHVLRFIGHDIGKKFAGADKMLVLADQRSLCTVMRVPGVGAVLVRGLEHALRSGRISGSVEVSRISAGDVTDIDGFIQEGSLRTAVSSRKGAWVGEQQLDGISRVTNIRVVSGKVYVRHGDAGAIDRFVIDGSGAVQMVSKETIVASSRLPGVDQPSMAFETVGKLEQIILTGFTRPGHFQASVVSEVTL